VTWTNVDDSPHTVTGSTAFDSGNLDPGQTFSFTFTEAGTFGYVCNYHDEMTASVTVTEATSGSGQEAPAPAAATPGGSIAAAPAAASHEAAGHGGEPPDTALPKPASGTLMAWVPPLLIGVGLVALAVGFVPERGTVVAASSERRRPPTGWRR